MTNETRKELIRLKTEFLKFYLIAVIGLITGVASLIAKDSRTFVETVLIFAGSIALPIVVFLVRSTTREMRRLAADLT